MEAIKSVLGLGGSAPPSDPEPVPAQNDLSGQEPIAGKQGAGTATDPYDAGNADGQSGSAPGQTPDVALNDSSSPGILKDSISSGSPKDSISTETPKDSISTETPKDSISTETPKDPSASYLNPTDFTTASATPEPSPAPQENISGYPGLQGHPIPVPEPTPTPFAQDRAPTQVNEQTQIDDTQPQGYISQLPTNTTTADRRENQTGGAGEPKPFVEQEAARIAKESEPSPPSDTNTGPATSTAASAADTDHDLAESTKKIHLKDKIKDKLHHFRKKTESTS